ncbi:KinB-signaling pathway activation protein [Paenibacillus marinisediminis]
MNLKKWSFLFWTTLCVGGAVMLLTGLSMQLFQQELTNFKGPVDIIVNILQLGLSGFMVSVFAQMGFFAYLTLNNIALGIFRKYWQYIQVVITVLVLLDIMFLRTLMGENQSLATDILLGAVMLVIAVVVAYYKARATNSMAFIPSMFFMIVVTYFEMLSALNVSQVATWFVFIPLVTCNAYQILLLHRLLNNNTQSASDQAQSSVITTKS